MRLRDQGWVAYSIWAVLIFEISFCVVTARWSGAFVAAATLVISLLPVIFAERFRVKLPLGFIGLIVLFVFSTIFLGEAFNFYERYWWWDVLLHGGSAVGFGLIGFIFVFIMFQGDRFLAPPLAVSFVAFCLAATIGMVWEIFEFFMDQVFGMNMQKSGLIDTMWDLIVDMIGASIGSFAGYLYLKGDSNGRLTSLIAEFVNKNKRLFRKISKKPPNDL